MTAIDKKLADAIARLSEDEKQKVLEFIERIIARESRMSTPQ